MTVNDTRLFWGLSVLMFVLGILVTLVVVEINDCHKQRCPDPNQMPQMVRGHGCMCLTEATP